MITCPYCQGTGFVPYKSRKYEGWVECPRCEGRGECPPYEENKGTRNNYHLSKYDKAMRKDGQLVK